jgi:PAS domain S-box-containing protein
VVVFSLAFIMSDDPRRALHNPDRLAALRRTALLDSPLEESFDRLTRLAARTLAAPIAIMNLVDADRQFCKSQVGLPEPLASQRVQSLEGSMCRHAITSDRPLVIEDAGAHPVARDSRPMREIGAVAYVGVPLITSDEYALGSLCVLDRKPRCWTEDEVATLQDLAAAVTTEVELRQEIGLRQQAEQARAAESGFNSAIVDTAGALVVVLDPEGRIVRFNRACEQVTGYVFDEVRGERFWNLFLIPEEVEAVKAEFARVRDGDVPKQRESVWVSKNGAHRVISWSNTAILDREGNPQYLVGTGIDITERREAEDALRESEELYRQMFVENRAVKLLIDPASGQIVDANPAACAFYGYSHRELLQLRIWDINTLSQADVEQQMSRAASRQHGQFTFPHRLASGEIRDVEIRSGPVNVKGRKLLYSVVNDISEQRSAEEQYRTILRTAMDGFWMVDTDGKILEVNDAYCQLSGYSRDELLQMHVGDVEATDISPDIAALVERVRATGGHRFETRHRRQDGTLVDLEVSVSCMDTDAGRLVAFFRDVTDRKRAEQALRDSEERFRLMVEGSEQVFFYVHDKEHRFQYLSPSIRQVLGYGPEELTGRPYEVVLTGDPSDAVVTEYTDTGLATGEGLSTYTALTRHKDGRTVTVELVESPLVQDGVVVGMQGFARDITERIAAEKELQIQKASLEQLFDNSPEAVVLLDNDNRVTRANPEFTRLFGYEMPEVIGARIDDLIVPHDKHSEAISITESIVQGKTISTDAVRLRKDGTPIHVSILGTPIHVDGNQVAVYGIYRDISNRKEAEVRLLAAEAHYRRLVESSPDGIYAIDADGRFTEVNPAAAHIAGRPAAELLGMPFATILAPEDHDLARRIFIERTSGEGAPREFELHVVRPSGERRLIQINSSAIDRGGGKVEVTGVVRDITDEQARETQLRRAERLATVGTLVGGVAHELNNPLTSIKSFAQLLLLDERSEEDLEALEIIRREADRTAKIVADLRRLARQTQEDSLTVNERVDLNEVVQHVLKVRRYSLDTHNVEVREELAAGLPPVLAVRSEMEQVMLNLVVNAEQALRGQTGERRLLVRTSYSRNRVSLHIADSGPGIRPEDLERIFDPFWTTKEPGEGTGLGLSLVHGIVTEHGGAIYVESTPEQGAAFTVKLPRAPLESSVAAPAASAVKPSRSLRVLVVDDEAAIRHSLARFLERRGHHVDEAAEGGAALERVGTADYDVILADLRMPGLGGDQLLARLRELGRGLEHRLIFITGDAVSSDAARFLSTVAVPVVLKPFELGELALLVEQHADAVGGAAV